MLRCEREPLRHLQPSCVRCNGFLLASASRMHSIHTGSAYQEGAAAVFRKDPKVLFKRLDALFQLLPPPHLPWCGCHKIVRLSACLHRRCARR